MDTSRGIQTFETNFGGTKIEFEVGKMGLLADGAVVVKYNESVVLATAVVKRDVKEGQDYFPLSVEFQDKWYATGRISGSRFIKREGRPSELAILRNSLFRLFSVPQDSFLPMITNTCNPSIAYFGYLFKLFSLLNCHPKLT